MTRTGMVNALVSRRPLLQAQEEPTEPVFRGQLTSQSHRWTVLVSLCRKLYQNPEMLPKIKKIKKVKQNKLGLILQSKKTKHSHKNIIRPESW